MGGLRADQLRVGDRFVTPTRTITETDVMIFAGMSGDNNELHTSRTYAADTPFERNIAHGLLVLAVSHGLMARTGIMEGTALAFLGIEGWRFTAPVYFGDTIHVEFTVAESRPTGRHPDRGVVTWEVAVKKQDGTVVQQGRQVSLLRRDPGA